VDGGGVAVDLRVRQRRVWPVCRRKGIRHVMMEMPMGEDIYGRTWCTCGEQGSLSLELER